MALTSRLLNWFLLLSSMLLAFAASLIILFHAAIILDQIRFGCLQNSPLPQVYLLCSIMMYGWLWMFVSNRRHAFFWLATGVASCLGAIAAGVSTIPVAMRWSPSHSTMAGLPVPSSAVWEFCLPTLLLVTSAILAKMALHRWGPHTWGQALSSGAANRRGHANRD